jgi:hypothetical protein
LHKPTPYVRRATLALGHQTKLTLRSTPESSSSWAALIQIQ